MKEIILKPSLPVEDEIPAVHADRIASELEESIGEEPTVATFVPEVRPDIEEAAIIPEMVEREPVIAETAITLPVDRTEVKIPQESAIEKIEIQDEISQISESIRKSTVKASCIGHGIFKALNFGHQTLIDQSVNVTPTMPSRFTLGIV
ncbi:hypothetical protein PHET_11934 [Paragonimus heterotremus]|uniref:Uncharacterized protein n=1 Tax=Paragonimus heterotremus TaxID=100268 RepID=A0A8J4SJB6_9TREM|nr:hypothetical protein PHET_11934 [Paragonimus heterotremus]